jgi:hypothetical protein
MTPLTALAGISAALAADKGDVTLTAVGVVLLAIGLVMMLGAFLGGGDGEN